MQKELLICGINKRFGELITWKNTREGQSLEMTMIPIMMMMTQALKYVMVSDDWEAWMESNEDDDDWDTTVT